MTGSDYLTYIPNGDVLNTIRYTSVLYNTVATVLSTALSLVTRYIIQNTVPAAIKDCLGQTVWVVIGVLIYSQNRKFTPRINCRISETIYWLVG